MSGLDLKQLRDWVVFPSLHAVGLWSKPAERLVLATGLVESRYRYLDQIDKHEKPGPARGLWQMEAATYHDIWERYLRRNTELASKIRPFIMDAVNPLEQLHGNLYYSCIMCRVFYLRFPEPLPKFDDIEGMGEYWKTYYNTYKGAGTVEKFIQVAKPVFEL